MPQDDGVPAQDWRSVAERAEDATPVAVERTRAAEPGRGRDTSAPGEIPARGWRDIFWRLVWSIPENRVLSTAGGVAFFALLAVFPGLATVVSLYGLLADAGNIGLQLAVLDGMVPDGVLALLGDELTRVASRPGGALGLAFLLGLAVALWGANSGVSALFDALDVVYKEREVTQPRALLRHDLPVHVGDGLLRPRGHRRGHRPASRAHPVRRGDPRRAQRGPSRSRRIGFAPPRAASRLIPDVAT